MRRRSQEYALNLIAAAFLPLLTRETGLGVQISKVRSATLDRWDAATIEFMRQHGNAVVNAILEARMPPEARIPADAPRAQRNEFIEAKYKYRKWALQDSTSS
jgi:hypothetical protein